MEERFGPLTPEDYGWKLTEEEAPRELNNALYKIAVMFEDPYYDVKGVDYFIPEGLYQYDEISGIFERYGRSEAYALPDVVAFTEIPVAYKEDKVVIFR